MLALVANSASDAAKNLLDSLNQSSITGWDLVAAVVVLVLSVPLARLAATAIRRALRRGNIASDEVASDLGRLAKWIVYLLGLALAATILGVNVGFVSVLFAFALVIGALMLRPMVENSASGILLISRPSFSIGDQIKSTEFRGTVVQIGSRATVLRQQDGVLVYISNNQVLGNPFEVYSSMEHRKSSFEIGVPASTDLDALSTAVTGAVGAVSDVADQPAPSVQATAVADNSVLLSVSYWYSATIESSSGVDDGAIRATMGALRDAGVELTVPDVKVTTSSSD